MIIVIGFFISLASQTSCLALINNTESSEYKLAKRTQFDKLLQGSVEFFGNLKLADGERVEFGLVCGRPAALQ